MVNVGDYVSIVGNGTHGIHHPFVCGDVGQISFVRSYYCQMKRKSDGLIHIVAVEDVQILPASTAVWRPVLGERVQFKAHTPMAGMFGEVRSIYYSNNSADVYCPPNGMCVVRFEDIGPIDLTPAEIKPLPIRYGVPEARLEPACTCKDVNWGAHEEACAWGTWKKAGGGH